MAMSIRAARPAMIQTNVRESGGENWAREVWGMSHKNTSFCREATNRGTCDLSGGSAPVHFALPNVLHVGFWSSLFCNPTNMVTARSAMLQSATGQRIIVRIWREDSFFPNSIAKVFLFSDDFSFKRKSVSERISYLIYKRYAARHVRHASSIEADP